jgi:pimeloyl-ACP methyl ester carboxylesterase
VSVLADRLLAVHAALDAAGVGHAFGGAIALAYCTKEPRGTRDLDLNVFVPPDDAARVLAALPEGVVAGESDIADARRDGQVRVWWDDTPLDLFFAVRAFHRHAAGATRTVPFEGAHIPVIDCVSLAVFKALFNRTRDWADIEAMFEAGALDGDEALVWVTELVGPDSQPADRLGTLVAGR